MFCPKCATQNVDGASYCRVCGANISLVPQALTGQLPEAQPADYPQYDGKGRRKRNRDDGPPSLEKGIVNLFMGIGFILAALAVIFRMPGGFAWGWCFFIPAGTMLGKGVASIVAAQKKTDSLRSAPGVYVAPAMQSARQPVFADPRRRNTGEMAPPPPSVTEGTTRHLGAEAPTKHLDSSDGRK
jgi:zinc-ribbon domain